MIDYILYVLVAIIVFGHLFSIFNIMSGNYTSIFVRFFSVVSVKSNQLTSLSKPQQKKFKSLLVLAGILHILITLVVLVVTLSDADSAITLLCILSYSANSMFFGYRTRKVLESNS